MNHVAIDLGGRKSQVCIRDEKGEIQSERMQETLRLRTAVATWPKSRVILETCAESFEVANWAEAAGHEVRVVPATLVRALGGGARGIKPYQRDARTLSEVSTRIDLPSVHRPSLASREQRTELTMRQALISARTKLINTVRGWLRGQVVHLKSGATQTFCLRVRERFGAELPDCVERQLQAIDALTEQISAAEASLREKAQGDEDGVCQRLMTVTGIGPMTSLAFKATVDQRERFPNVSQLESYLGLTPGEKSSSERTCRTSITKAGKKYLRTLLVQAAWTVRRCRPDDPITQWNLRVEHRRGKYVAVVALARKLAGILFAIWRDGTTYNPAKAAAPLALEE
jgi:transposase